MTTILEAQVEQPQKLQISLDTDSRLQRIMKYRKPDPEFGENLADFTRRLGLVLDY